MHNGLPQPLMKEETIRQFGEGVVMRLVGELIGELTLLDGYGR